MYCTGRTTVSKRTRVETVKAAVAEFASAVAKRPISPASVTNNDVDASPAASVRTTQTEALQAPKITAPALAVKVTGLPEMGVTPSVVVSRTVNPAGSLSPR